MVRTRAAVAAAVVVGLAGCKVAFDAPADARITCSSDAECPSGWFCKPALGRCSQAHDDGLPPTLRGAATVSPGFAARGTLVTVRFEASDALGVSPVVELATAPARTPFLLYSQVGLVYTYALVVGPAIPEGTYPVLGKLVSATGAVAQDLALGTIQVDATPPAISRIDVLTPRVRAGQRALLEATFGEALTVPPTARILGGGALVTAATAQPNVWRFGLDVTGAELEDPPASVELTAQDAAGNVATRTATDALVFDFTAPALAAPAVVATPAVRTGQQIVVHASFTEPLAAPPAVRLLGRSTAAVITLAVAEQVGTAFTFGATVQPGAAQEVYDVQLRSFADVAGNAGTDAAAGTVVVDATAPSLTAGPAPVKAGARYRVGERPSFTLTADEPLASAPVARLGTTPPLPATCTAGAGLAWTCTLDAALSGAEVPESAVKAIFDLADPAGNTATFSADAVLDFHDPAVVGSVALDLTPPAGSLVSPVTAVRAGTRIRVSFTVNEPLAADPVVVTSTPEALSFAKVSQSGTFYVYEHVLGAAAHAQGAYTVRAQLEDLAGNRAAPLLALPAPGIRVDTGTPASPDVVTTGAITYARVPWGTAATGGAPQFTIAGVAGSVEANATVVAYDGESVSSAREIGRATATAAGAFGPMTLIAADRREVFVVAVDAAGNASDARPAAGVQAVRVRDVTWTATLQNKVLGSAGENPHRLEARARWLGALEQGASAEALLATSTVGTLGWKLASTPGWITGTPIATDTRRGRLVVPTPTAVWEWDGEVWTSVAATGGPAAITATVYDARRAEVLVYEGACEGGTTLWAWTGKAWEPRAQGASYTQWGAYGSPAPGPHRKAFLAYDEARGEVILAPGPQFNLGPYTCGDVSGNVDYGTYRWDGTAWHLLPGASTYGVADGRWLAYDANREVVARKSVGGLAEWDGEVWTTIDPAGITTGPSAAASGEAAYDPVLRRILFQADGDTWTWTGTNWVRSSTTSVTGNLARGWGDSPSDRLLAVGSSYIYRWTGTWSAIASSSAGPPAPVGVVYSSGRARSEAFDVSGSAYRWSPTYSGWVDITPATHPSGIAAASALDATGATALAHATDRGAWTWDGSTFTSVTPASAVRPPSTAAGMAWVSGTGPVLLSSGGTVYYWSASQWTSDGTVTPYCTGTPAAAPGLPGIYFSCTVPYDPDRELYRWTRAGSGARVYGGAGLGVIHPIAADGSNRTFVLQSDGLFQLSGSTLAPVSVDDPRGAGHPTSVDASTWDAGLQAVMVLSGARTWLLESEAKSRPGHLFRVAWPAGGGPGGDCFQRGSTCTVRNVAVSWRGLLSSDGSGGSTATLSLWNEARWVQVASATSTSAATPASASVTVTDAALLGHLASLPASEIDLAVTLPATSLPAPLLRTDDVAVTVTYRLP